MLFGEGELLGLGVLVELFEWFEVRLMVPWSNLHAEFVILCVVLDFCKKAPVDMRAEVSDCLLVLEDVVMWPGLISWSELNTWFSVLVAAGMRSSIACCWVANYIDTALYCDEAVADEHIGLTVNLTVTVGGHRVRRMCRCSHGNHWGRKAVTDGDMQAGLPVGSKVFLTSMPVAIVQSCHLCGL